MADSSSVYQYVLITLLLIWLVPLVAIWVRFDGMPHNRFMLLAVFCWPLLLVDEWLRAFDTDHTWLFLAGTFQFVPLLITCWLVLSTKKLVSETPPEKPAKYYLPAIVMAASQVPFLLLPVDAKSVLFLTPPVDALLSYWMYYLPYFFSAVCMLVMITQAAEWLNEYHNNVSEIVVDVHFYRYKSLYSGFLIMLAVAFIEMALVLLAAFGLMAPTFWQTAINIINALILFFLLLVMLEKRRYAPSPIDFEALEKKQYSDEYLATALNEVEKAIIRHKAYKRIGLRLRHLADAAGVEPLAVAQATRKNLNRNFRAFIYHYRLEYAKKILMQTDAKVSVVAKRLGFTSEKYLSDMFVKYIRLMGKDKYDEGEENLF